MNTAGADDGSGIRASLSGQLQRWVPIDRLKVIVAPLRGTVEFEQSLLRIFIGGIVLAYLAWSIPTDRQVDAGEAAALAVAVSFFIFGVGMAINIWTVPDASSVRRIIGMVADNAATTFCLVQMGERGAGLLGVYLFITFSNGFRYGRMYFHIGQLLSLAGFGLVILNVPWWRSERAVAVGWIYAIIILPMYVAVLVERLKRGQDKQQVDAAG